MSLHSLRESWFERQVPNVPSSSPELVDDDVLIGREGRVGWALFLSGFGGGVGGAAMLFVSRALAGRFHLGSGDVIRTIGGSAGAAGLDAFRGGIVIAVVLGALVGMLFGALLRYSVRAIARLLAAAMLAPVLWTLVHAFVFKSFAPGSLGGLPFGPMIAGAVIYGLCVAILPPPRKRLALRSDLEDLDSAV